MSPPSAESIFRDRWIHLVGPGKDTTFKVENFAKARLAQKFHGLRGALAAAAMRHDLSGAIEFAHTTREIAERNQMAAEVADLIFVRLAHVKDEEIISAIEPGLQFACRNFRDGCLRRGSFFATNTAELGVVNELGDGRMRAAHRTFRIFPHF